MLMSAVLTMVAVNNAVSTRLVPAHVAATVALDLPLTQETVMVRNK